MGKKSTGDKWSLTYLEVSQSFVKVFPFLGEGGGEI